MAQDDEVNGGMSDMVNEIEEVSGGCDGIDDMNDRKNEVIYGESEMTDGESEMTDGENEMTDGENESEMIDGKSEMIDGES